MLGTGPYCMTMPVTNPGEVFNPAVSPRLDEC